MFRRRDERDVKLISRLEEQIKWLKEFREKYYELINDVRNLERKNALFKQMFDDADDTSVVKYNGKLFKITDISHCKSGGYPDTLRIDAVVVYPEGE